MKTDNCKETKEEVIKYFKQLSHDYSIKSRRSNDCLILAAKSEAYELAAFHLEKNAL